MRRFLFLAAVMCFGVASAGAQTNISGTLQCGKPDPQHVVAVGDRPDHSLGVEQFKCTWSKPWQIEGVKSKEGISTGTMDVSGNTLRVRGFHVDTMENGDKNFSWYQHTSEVKDGALQSAKGTWGFTGGTGKFKGLKGKGTYSCAPSGDGVACECKANTNRRNSGARTPRDCVSKVDS